MTFTPASYSSHSLTLSAGLSRPLHLTITLVASLRGRRTPASVPSLMLTAKSDTTQAPRMNHRRFTCSPSWNPALTPMYSTSTNFELPCNNRTTMITTPLPSKLALHRLHFLRVVILPDPLRPFSLHQLICSRPAQSTTTTRTVFSNKNLRTIPNSSSFLRPPTLPPAVRTLTPPSQHHEFWAPHQHVTAPTSARMPALAYGTIR
jgi:hypothetical protein